MAATGAVRWRSTSAMLPKVLPRRFPGLLATPLAPTAPRTLLSPPWRHRASMTTAAAAAMVALRRRRASSWRGVSLAATEETVQARSASSSSTSPSPSPGLDLKLAMVMAGFSFDSYTLIDDCSGIWACDGGGGGIGAVKKVLLAPAFVTEAYQGILRVRPLEVKGLDLHVATGVAVAFRMASASPWALQASTRSSMKRGLFSMLRSGATWRDEDDSLYLYVPRVLGEEPAAMEPRLELELQICNIVGALGHVKGRASLPLSALLARGVEGSLRELSVELEAVPHPDGEEETADEEEQRPLILELQLHYDSFPGQAAGGEGTAAAPPPLALQEVMPVVRDWRNRWGTAVPSEVLRPQVKMLTDGQLQAALRGRGLPCLGEGRDAMIGRLKKVLEAEEKLRSADSSTWDVLEGLVGSSAREGLEGTLGTLGWAKEAIGGDVLGAVGAGLSTGASYVSGVEELLQGDFQGAWRKRMEVVEASKTEEGRQALSRKVDVAMQAVRQQAMLRLANGMELMSVRRGAWKMLESAVLLETDSAENFKDYEQLAYLEAESTNTECYVWRLQHRQRLLVTFRGTSDFGDVLTDISAIPKDLGEQGRVHSGFHSAYASIKDALQATLALGCGGDAAGWEVLFTGHSLGGALATLAALDVAQAPTSTPLAGAQVLMCSFGAPRVGDDRFATRYDECVPNSWRVYSKSDIIPTVPPTSLFGFRHGGIGVELDPSTNTLTVRGRTAATAKLAAAAAAAAAEERRRREEQEAEEQEGGFGLPIPLPGVSASNDVWAAFDKDELQELREVLGAGTQVVSEHMEDNYFSRIRECLSAELKKRPPELREA